jgi:multiple sugar transport system permease protein
MKKKSRNSFSLNSLFINFILVFFAIIMLIPTIWLLISPSKDAVGLARLSPFQFGSFSSYFTRWHHLINYQNGIFLQWIKNSLIYTSISVIIGTVISAMAGFALAAVNLKFKKQILILVLVAMIMPNVALVLPIFVWFNQLHLANNPIGLIMVYCLHPFGVYLSYIYFANSIPREIYESARMDGCSYFGTFRRIGIPLAKGLIGVISFFNFTSTWSNFFLPQTLILDPAKAPLSSGLQALFTGTEAFTGQASYVTHIDRPEIALAALMMIAPVVFVFIVSQKLIGRGMLAGAVKS